MNILEADYGIGPLRDVEECIESGIHKLFHRNKEQPWFDGCWMNEYGEVLHGALLVAGQAYLVGAVTDINSIRLSVGVNELSKIEAYHKYPIRENGHSLIELVNAGANYFKHHEEWGEEWPNNITTRTISSFSFTSEYILNEIVFEIIKSKYSKKSLWKLLFEWREQLISETKHSKETTQKNG
ncbi:MAG: hypothetical protein D3904_00080 [Candidatus Electrothrix sp. EH2]|nr:hypothetical protein [Candidatus Electrothrix sp. EH2]